jgi:hypothetical protein
MLSQAGPPVSVAAGALDLDQVAGAEVGDAGVVEGGALVTFARRSHREQRILPYLGRA